MSDEFVKWRKTDNIQPLSLPNKSKFYRDLLNIEHSWSGRLDIGNIGNTFIYEAEQLLVNAIELFELGYFDCAYYSLRSAVDMSTTMAFLSDMPSEEREPFLDAWKETKDFPMQGQMIKLLSEKGNVFSDMKENMPAFFIDAKQLSSELNKYVHKQGLTHFYVSRNHPINGERSQDSFFSDFENYLRRCIGVVAVMRLTIDPFPVLLMDEEILYRCFDSITDPYSKDFAEEYIGYQTIENYKATDIYKYSYDDFIREERKSEEVFNVIKHQYIDSREIDVILRQQHLLTRDDLISVLMVQACSKVVKIYCYHGLQMYFTEKDTNRKAMSWAGLDFKNFSEAETKVNQPYDEAFISVFVFNEVFYFVEHNETLDIEDIENIEETVEGALSKIEEDMLNE